MNIPKSHGWKALFFALLVSGMLNGADSSEMDVNASNIPAGAAERDLPVRPGSAFDKRLGYFAGEQLVGERFFYDNKQVQSELVLGVGGRNGICRTWHPNGQPRSLIPYRNGSIDGTAKQWSSDGKLLGSFQMIGGTGMEIVWNEKGAIYSITSYCQGKKSGLMTKYFPSGSIQSVQTYKDDRMEGLGYLFHSSRAVRQVATFKDDGVIGPLLILDEAGKPVSGTPTWHFEGKAISREEYEHLRIASPSLPAAEPLWPTGAPAK